MGARETAGRQLQYSAAARMSAQLAEELTAAAYGTNRALIP
jgi:hypothetical protein